jgi:hypothetical protein
MRHIHAFFSRLLTAESPRVFPCPENVSLLWVHCSKAVRYYFITFGLQIRKIAWNKKEKKEHTSSKNKGIFTLIKMVIVTNIRLRVRPTDI